MSSRVFRFCRGVEGCECRESVADRNYCWCSSCSLSCRRRLLDTAQAYDLHSRVVAELDDGRLDGKSPVDACTMRDGPQLGHFLVAVAGWRRSSQQAAEANERTLSGLAAIKIGVFDRRFDLCWVLQLAANQ